MPRTTRRQTFSVSTSSNDYPVLQTFAQTTFAGINEDKNQLAVDQNSFADAENVYVDENNALVNRPALAATNDRFIFRQWQFGPYAFRMYRLLSYRVDNQIDPIEYIVLEDGDPGDHLLDDLYYVFRLVCTSHATTNNQEWYVPVKNYQDPSVACTSMTSGIFCWFKASPQQETSLVVFDTTDEMYSFVNGAEYLYHPIHEIILNDRPTIAEGKNLFVDRYIKRYVYSADSFVNFRELSDGYVNYVDKNGATERLYQADFQDAALSNGKTLLHPHARGLDNYLFDAIATARATIFLRYSRDLQEIAVSFDGVIYKTLPFLEHVISEPQFTEDGFSVVVFTEAGVAFCKIVRASTDDFAVEDIFAWKTIHYPFFTDLTSFTPVGHFLDDENFCYIVRELDTGKTILSSYLSRGLQFIYVTTNEPEYEPVIDVVDATLKMQIIPATNTLPAGAAIMMLGKTHEESFIFAYTENRGVVYDDGNVSWRAWWPLTRLDAEIIQFGFSLRDFNYLRGTQMDLSFVEGESVTDGTIRCDIRTSFVGNAGSVEGRELTLKVILQNGLQLLQSVRFLTPFFKDSIYYKKSASTNDIFTEKVYARGATAISMPDVTKELLSNGDLISLHTADGIVLRRIYRVELLDDTYDLSYDDLSGATYVVLALPDARLAKDLLKPFSTDSNVFRVRGELRNGQSVSFRSVSVVYEGYTYDANAENDFDNVMIENHYNQIPLAGDSDGLWYHSGDTIWTSAFQDGDRLEMDQPCGTGELQVMPEMFASLDDHYFVFGGGKAKLGVTSPRQNENGDDLLYADETEIQTFAVPITNLHPLSDTSLGIFTENEIWYVTRQFDGEGDRVHTKPVRSKIPFGCKKGCDVITALDGQAIVFATSRGIAALAPQDFIATTDKTMSYLSDAIVKTYESFWSRPVKSALLYRENGQSIDPAIKILAHKYWLIFYRYLDRELLLLDMRNASWWKWTLPYPLLKVIDGESLSFLLQIDFPSVGKHVDLPKSHGGVHFVNRTDAIYADQIIPRALSGDYLEAYGNRFRPAQLIMPTADPVINWHFTSQKLHLGAPQNYKGIKALFFNVRGDDTIQAKLSTKVYRDAYHPEQTETIEVAMNELRTFFKRVNLQHVTSFQYTVMNDAINRPLCLDSFGVKYEVKEKLR